VRGLITCDPVGMLLSAMPTTKHPMETCHPADDRSMPTSRSLKIGPAVVAILQDRTYPHGSLTVRKLAAERALRTWEARAARILFAKCRIDRPSGRKKRAR
jgi:hypothetical protein